MYFVLSKVGWLLLQPSTLLFTATLIGALLMATPLARFGRWLALIAGSLLAICALTPLCVVLDRPLENRFPARSLDAIANPTGIIALGGAFNGAITRARGPIALSTAGSRVTEAAALALRFPKARLIFTGGSANLIGKGIAEGDVAEDFFSELDVPKDQVTIERKSRNTYENAQFLRALIEPKAGEKWILITSAFHMPRAVASFEKAGFDVAPHPVDYLTLGTLKDYWDYTFSPVAALQLLDTAAKEWVGLAVYRLSGKTAEFLPKAKQS